MKFAPFRNKLNKILDFLDYARQIKSALIQNKLNEILEFLDNARQMKYTPIQNKSNIRTFLRQLTPILNQNKYV